MQPTLTDDSGRLLRLSFDSAGCTPEEAFAKYAARIAVGFDITDPAPAFHARIDTYRLGGAIVHLTDVGGLTFTRSAAKAARDQMGHILFQLILEGEWDGDFDGVPQTAGAGDIVAMDMARPMWKRTSDLKSVAVGLSRGETGGLRHVSRRLHGAVVRGEQGQILAEHLRALSRHLPRSAAGSAPGLGEATRHLFAAALAVTQGIADEDDRAVDRVRQVIRERLGDPDLSPQTLASVAGVSRAALYRLFGGQGGVSKFIWRQRLIRIRRALADPSDKRPMSQIARERGFISEAHFSRAFRLMFGQTPGSMRGPEMPPEASLAGQSKAASTFAAWVQDLG